MTHAQRIFHLAADAVAHTRSLGYDCRNIIVEQPHDHDIVRVVQGKASVIWNGQYFRYHGRPSRALAHFTHEFSQLAK